jgi:hypothetical protein
VSNFDTPLITSSNLNVNSGTTPPNVSKPENCHHLIKT